MGLLISIFLALVASIKLLESKPSYPTLYCLSHPASTSITTLNFSLPRAQCFSVQDGLFTAIYETIPESHKENIIELDGWVIPGIIESHGHILQYGEMLESVSLYGADSMDEVRRRVGDFLDKHRGEGYGTREKWVRGVGWDQAFVGGVMPTAVSHVNTKIEIQCSFVCQRNLC